MNEKPEQQARLRTPFNAAFSLVELLITIAIIALLLTVAVPSLTRAKGLAKRAVCLANLRRLAVAVNTYSAKFDDYMPPDRLSYRPGKSMTAANVYTNEYGRQKPRWHWFLEEGSGPVIERVDYANEADFQAATEMSNDYFLCPSVADIYANDIRHGAYGYNHSYLGSGRSKTDGKYVPINWPVRISRILDTSNTVMFADSRGAIDTPEMGIRQHAYTLDPPRLAVSVGFTEFGPIDDIDSAVPSKYMNSPADARHMGLANVAFADGNSRPISLSELGYVLDDDGIVIKDDPRGDNALWTGREDNAP